MSWKRTKTISRVPRRSLWPSIFFLGTLPVSARQRDGKRRPYALRAADFNPAVVGQNQLPGDGQPQAAAGARARAVATPEAVKDIGQIRCRDTAARVRHPDLDAVVLVRRRKRNRAASRRVAQ